MGSTASEQLRRLKDANARLIADNDRYKAALERMANDSALGKASEFRTIAIRALFPAPQEGEE